MMLGKKLNPAEDGLIQGLKPLRAEFETKQAKLADLRSQVENYENGFLHETKSLDKNIMVIAEHSMRMLEKLDGYSIGEVWFVEKVKVKIIERTTKLHGKSARISSKTYRASSISVTFCVSD